MNRNLKTAMFCFVMIMAIAIFAMSDANAKSQTAALANVVRVIDGDTIVVNVPSWPDIVGKNISVRFLGIDTPELRSKDPKEKILAKLAKSALLGKLPPGTIVILSKITRGSFFRIVAVVSPLCGENINQWMLEEGYAVPYK